MKNYINISLGLLLFLGSCEESDTKFRSSTTPCNKCEALKIVNKRTGNTIYFDEKNSMTLRAPMYEGHDSLIITRNGITEVALSNFKRLEAMDDKQSRNIYFKSVTEQGVKSMRFHYPKDADFFLITSQLLDGAYRADLDTLDIYYKLIN